MPLTPVYGIPYPSLSDPPNGPAQMGALATEVENELIRVDATAASQGARITTLETNVTAPPLAVLRQTVAQSIPHATQTAIQFNAEDLDTAGGHDNVTNNTRYTAQKAGKYLLGGAVNTVSATGFRGVVWFKNGSAVPGSQIDSAPVAGSEWPVAARTIIVTLAVSDFVELRLFQDTGGGALNTGVSSDVQSTMTVAFLSV